MQFLNIKKRSEYFVKNYRCRHYPPRTVPATVASKHKTPLSSKPQISNIPQHLHDRFHRCAGVDGNARNHLRIDDFLQSRRRVVFHLRMDIDNIALAQFRQEQANIVVGTPYHQGYVRRFRSCPGNITHVVQ